ncbi:MAG TPA: tetratricopeptide repeat protein [Burkholderiales bacterium]|nr:tetratricopeptide repeat protein [Burkholderiales bacterium]
MRLPRSIAAVVLSLGLSLSTAVWAQGDPLQEANQLFRQGQFDKAMDRVNGYLSSRPKDARGRFLKGLILTEQNKPGEAIKVFTDLSQDYPELPEPYNNLAVLYASQGQYDKARNSLEMAIRTHPSYATAHENLGDIYAKMASQAYDKALQLDRSNTAAQGKLNLIKELFSQTPRTQTAAAPSKGSQVAVNKVEPTPAPPSQPVPAPAAPAKSAAKSETVAAAPAKSAPEPRPEAKAAPEPKDTAKAAPAKAANGDADVMKAVNAWARAWASNDVPGYLSFYAPDFQTPKGMSRSAWEAERKARIQKPRKIEVDIDNPRVKMDGNKAVVSFRQHYHSGSLNVTSAKTLVMVRNGDKWLIQQERSGS